MKLRNRIHELIDLGQALALVIVVEFVLLEVLFL